MCAERQTGRPEPTRAQRRSAATRAVATKRAHGLVKKKERKEKCEIKDVGKIRSNRRIADHRMFGGGRAKSRRVVTTPRTGIFGRWLRRGSKKRGANKRAKKEYPDRKEKEIRRKKRGRLFFFWVKHFCAFFIHPWVAPHSARLVSLGGLALGPARRASFHCAVPEETHRAGKATASVRRCTILEASAIDRATIRSALSVCMMMPSSMSDAATARPSASATKVSVRRSDSYRARHSSGLAQNRRKTKGFVPRGAYVGNNGRDDDGKRGISAMTTTITGEEGKQKERGQWRRGRGAHTTKRAE